MAKRLSAGIQRVKLIRPTEIIGTCAFEACGRDIQRQDAFIVTLEDKCFCANCWQKEPSPVYMPFLGVQGQPTAAKADFGY